MTFDEYLKNHGIKKETADRFGWYLNEKNAIVMPIRDAAGVHLFDKLRHLAHEDDPKFAKFTYNPTGNEAQLYNSSVIATSSMIVIVEGEPDVVRLAQAKIPAVCSTSGAGTFKPEWAEMLKGKKVFICLDTDKAGKDGTALIQELLPLALVIDLPTDGKEKNDISDYLMVHKESEFNALVAKEIKKNAMTFDQLSTVIDRWLLLPDKNVIKVVMAATIAHFFDTSPCWMFLVAPPSGTKTEIISSLNNLPFIYQLSKLTPQTLASGMVGKDTSLLPKLNGKIMTMKDFTTILTMRAESQGEILSQLREVYDGSYTQEWGTGKRLDWEGKVGLIAGVTSVIDKYSSVFQLMGERFLMYRVPQPRDIDMALKATSNTGSEVQMRDELRVAFRRFFSNITIPSMDDIKVPDEIRLALANLASFAVIARSGVVRNPYSKEIEQIPIPEAPARLMKQLTTVLCALAVLENRTVVNWQDYFLIVKIAFDVVAQNRTKHISALSGTMSVNTRKTSIISTETGYSPAGSELILEDLVALGLAGVSRSGGVVEWYMSEKTRGYFSKILPIPPHEIIPLQQVFPPSSSHYNPIIDQILALSVSSTSSSDA